MKLLSKKIRHEATYLFVVAITRIFNILPRDICQFIAAWLGFAASRLLARDRHKAIRHLGLAFPGLSPGEKETIARDMFVNFGKNAADVLRLKKYYQKELKPLITVEGIEHFDKVYNRGKGVIAVTGHIGNFELLACYFAGQGYRAAAIGRELYEKRLNALLIENRTSLGLVNIDTRESPRTFLRLLKDGYILGVLMDTDSFRVRSKLIPAFGRLSNTPVGQSVLGLKTGAGFVPVACVRTPKGYKVIVRPEITIERTDNFETDLYNVTLACTKELEKIITAYMDQWIWLHNRWHTRPENEPHVAFE